jgi:light-regulated signal transduction histidine kinase (bacteriophytochrome)
VLAFAILVQENCADLPSDSETHRHLQIMLQNVPKMGTIIDELLLPAGAHQMKAGVREPLDMENIVAEALQRLTQIIEEHEAKITVPPSWPIAVGYGP